MNETILKCKVRDQRVVLGNEARNQTAELLTERMQELLEFAHYRGFEFKVDPNCNKAVVVIKDVSIDGVVTDQMLGGGDRYSVGRVLNGAAA